MKKKLKRTLPNIDLNDQSLWKYMYEESKRTNASTPQSIEKFKKTRLPKVILFMSEIYDGRAWYNSLIKRMLPEKYGFSSKSLHSKVLEKWMGTRDKKLIIKTLEEKKYIKVDHSYVASNSNATQKSYSKEYGIHPKYYDEQRYKKNIVKFEVKESLLENKEKAEKQYLVKKDEYTVLHQRGANQISINRDKFLEILEFLKKSKPNSVNENDLLKTLEKSDANKLESFKSTKNNNTGQRIYNDLMRLNSEFRCSFDLGESAVEVEIRNAVPYLFATYLLKKEFSNNQFNKYCKLVNAQIIEKRDVYGDELYENIELPEVMESAESILSKFGFDNGIDYFRNSQYMHRIRDRFLKYYEGKPYTQKNFKHNVSEETKEKIDILVLTTFSAFAKSYELFELVEKNDEEIATYSKSPNYGKLKKDVNAFLNASSYQRKMAGELGNLNGKVKNIFKFNFPSILNVINEKRSRDVFFIIMQNLESKLMGETVIPQYFEKRDEPFLGIHDGVICRRSSSIELKEMIQTESKKLFGVIAPVSIREIDNPLNDTDFHDISDLLN